MTEFVFPPAAIPSHRRHRHNARFPVRRVWCVGRNYLAHIREMGNDEREPPFFFSKQPDMVRGRRHHCLSRPDRRISTMRSNWWWR